VAGRESAKSLPRASCGMCAAVNIRGEPWGNEFTEFVRVGRGTVFSGAWDDFCWGER
jgi:hypothetical protein